ncbi:MAG: aminotransferase class III-fold pyridoxal phosphate-dependent enzyme [Verrucomicrobia bacterium]|nr:aminotransferase class III-fold pyridoxal phosphate-dependent enzyme [Verrucomicrobiota bacterium]
MHPLAKLDHAHVWHPFTQMRDWLEREPILITSGKGAVLHDVQGREYLDGNSSIWTNLHGHQHPKINAAINGQLKKIAHSSALGLANEPASVLAERLVQAAAITNYDLRFTKPQPSSPADRRSEFVNRNLDKVFFSDDGSTALEVALKLAYEFTRRTRGPKSKPRFLSLAGAYHGDTIGAVSLGQIDLFHGAYSRLLFKTDRVMAPYCYRCPFNRAKPEREDARKYRKCNWECVTKVDQALTKQKKRGEPYAAFVFEPLMQGAAGMIPQPSGWLRQTTDLARAHGALLIADEVMTGFGRTGVTCHVDDTALARVRQHPEAARAFATTRVGVPVDFLCLAKGLTGGYLPMAATLTSQRVFDAFLGDYEEFKTFFHGHSYTGNQLGSAAALASLDILQSRASVVARAKLQRALHDELKSLWALPNVGDIRQVGLIAGIELVRDWRTREPFELRERAGIRVCEAMAKRGVLTRPIGSVVALMPPYCTTPAQVRKMVQALAESVEECLGRKPRPQK